MDQLIPFLEEFIHAWGALGVFVASAAEEIIAFIPSSVVQVGSGFLILGDQPHSLQAFLTLFFMVVLPVSAGVVVGSLGLYALGYFLGHAAVEKWGKWLHITPQDVSRMEKFFQKGNTDEWAVFFLRAIPIFPNTPVGILCGLARIPLKTFVIYTFLGMLIRASIQGYIGWRLGSLYYQYSDSLSIYKIAGLALVGIAVIWGYFWLRRKALS